MEKCDRGGGRSHRTTRQTVIERVDFIPFLALLTIGFYAILAHWDARKYAIEGNEISYRCIKTSIIIMIVPPPTDG